MTKDKDQKTPKDKEKELPKQGTKITGRKASAESYMPLYEFLLFDPLYREMKDKAKILYTFLRKKTTYFEKQTKAYEEMVDSGEEIPKGTKSYRDENDDIFCIADNSELAVVLQCHSNRVKDQRDELVKYGLLIVEPQDKKAHRLYVLEPSELTTRWKYIDEMKELREKTRLANLAKAEKTKAKNKADKSSASKGSETNSQIVSQPSEETNSRIVSQSNSRIVGQSNSRIVGKIYYKSFKRTSKFLKVTSNLSRPKELEELFWKDLDNVPLDTTTKIVLKRNKDRLIRDNISLFDIHIFYNSTDNMLADGDFNNVLDNVLQFSKKPIINIKNLLKIAIKNYMDEVQKEKPVVNEIEELHFELSPAIPKKLKGERRTLIEPDNDLGSDDDMPW